MATPLPSDPGYFDLPTASFPKGWGKSARETKGNYLFDAINQALGAGANEANRLTNLEEQRGQAAEDTLRAADQVANVPTLTQNDINLQFGRGVDTSGNAFMQTIGNLRSMLGANGLSGSSGYAGGLAAAAEGQRLGSILSNRRDLMVEKATTDATDRLKEYDRQAQIAQAVARPVAAENSDFYQMLAGVRLSQGSGEQARSAAKDAANASKDAGWMSLGGQLGGALIGAIL